MFVEGTLRWQVTEDCPEDLLMALALRDLGAISNATDPVLPAVLPRPPLIPAPAVKGRQSVRDETVAIQSHPPAEALREQWRAWWDRIVRREYRELGTQLRPPHFSAFDRALELQDLIEDYYEVALAWSRERYAEYVEVSANLRAQRIADIVEVVHSREHQLRRQASYFRLDLNVMPLARPGAWIVAPHTVVVSLSFRYNSAEFRGWFEPLVSALV